MNFHPHPDKGNQDEAATQLINPDSKKNLEKFLIFCIDYFRLSVIVVYNSKTLLRSITIFIRIEPSSSVPIYRQIIDQIKYQVATGMLKEGDKVPSVRELAAQLAVNQNTILKVYNELCRENVLKIERGDGTYVSSSKQNIPVSERKKAVANSLREVATLAVQLDLPLEQVSELLEKEYKIILSQKAGSLKKDSKEK